MSMRLSRGISSDGANDVALPSVAKAIAPAATSSAAGTHVATLPICCNPFAGGEPKDIEEGRQPQEPEHERDRVPAAVRNGRAVRTKRHQHVRAGEEQQRREVKKVIDPHAPAAHEPVSWSKGATRPRVDAALLRMPAG